MLPTSNERPVGTPLARYTSYPSQITLTSFKFILKNLKICLELMGLKLCPIFGLFESNSEMYFPLRITWVN